MNLDELDTMPEAWARNLLSACCGSRQWLDSMVERRPFGDRAGLFAAAEAAADTMDRDAWLDAFSHHPRIGDLDTLRDRFGARSGSWSESEQAAVGDADDTVLERLADANARYEARFDHVFIVCASGKRADEMLALLEARLDNEPTHELTVASDEQRKIMRLRLDKLLAAPEGDT
ncbi:MAG: 2-oxo-4-hydroxy-4-carboxy-5-ureidoimidazoline decarboxylase [Acidobacteriota bacterium]